MTTIHNNVKIDKKVPKHIIEKADRVISEHKAKILGFQKAMNKLYWHFTLPQYYKVVYHEAGDYYRVMSSQDYHKYQKTYCR